MQDDPGGLCQVHTRRGQRPFFADDVAMVVESGERLSHLAQVDRYTVRLAGGSDLLERLGKTQEFFHQDDFSLVR